MSFGGSQGTVRYAVVLQDQASAPIQKLSNEFRNMGTGMTTLTQKTNAFNSAIISNARTFTASITPIKNTGNALNQLSIQQKTIGSQLATIGSGFKNNALAIGAAASSVLGLYQNYANLSSAQNSANKAATAAKAAQNNLVKAQDNLNKAISKYGAGSKEAIAAQNKLTVAQERASQKAESAKIAQDNLNQTMADFGINVLPNVLLAGGSITSIFDNISLKGKSLGGIVSKLGGLFGGLGTSVIGAGGGFKGLLSSITGIGGGMTGLGSNTIKATSSLTGLGSGATDLTGTLNNTGKSAGGLKSSLIGLGATVGVIGLVTAGALELAGAMNQVVKPFSTIKQPVSVLEASLDKTGKSLDIFNQTLAETQVMATAGVTPAIVALDAAFKTHMTETLLKNAGYLDENGQKTKLFTDKIAEMNKTVKEGGGNLPILTQAVSDLGEGFKNSSSEFAVWGAEMLDNGKTAKEVGTWLSDSHIKESDALKILDKAMVLHLQHQKDLDTAFQKNSKNWATITENVGGVGKSFVELGDGMGLVTHQTDPFNAGLALANVNLDDTDKKLKTLTGTFAKMSMFVGGVGKNFVEVANGAALVTNQTDPFNANMAEANTILPKVSSFTQLFGDKMKVLEEATAKYNSSHPAKGMDSFNAAIQSGADRFSDFISTTELGAVTNKRYHDALLQTVGAQVQIPPALDLTTSQLESMQTALDNSKVGLTENANASAILADALDQQLAPSIQTLGGALTALSSKEFKKAFKDLDFGAAGKGFKKFASELDKNISQINKEAGRMDVIFSQLSVALSIDKLPHKQWVEGLQGISKEVTKIGKIQKIDLSGITDFIAKAQNIKDPVQLAKYQKVIALITEKSKGGFNATELNEIATAITGIGESSGSAAPKVDKNAAAIKTFGVSSASARGQIDQVTGAIDTLAGQAAKIHPTIIVNTDQALGLLGELKRAWDKVGSQLSKNVPKLTVNPDQALDMIGTLKRGWDKVAGQMSKQIPKLKVNADQALDMIGEVKRGWDKAASQISKKVPTIKVNADQALDMIGEVKRGMDSIKSKSVNINVGASGSGLRFAQKGMHETLAMDTLIQAHKGERVDIGHGGDSGSNSGRSSGGGGSGGGDLVVNNMIDLGDSRIIRSFKRKLGSDRYTFGG